MALLAPELLDTTGLPAAPDFGTVLHDDAPRAEKDHGADEQRDEQVEGCGRAHAVLPTRRRLASIHAFSCST